MSPLALARTFRLRFSNTYRPEIARWVDGPTELHDALEKLRRAQNDLIRSEKLASMGRLVAGIAHEINNPVNAVINTLAPLEEAIKAMVAVAFGEFLVVDRQDERRSAALLLREARHVAEAGDAERLNPFGFYGLRQRANTEAARVLGTKVLVDDHYGKAKAHGFCGSAAA